ncbi:hypothetical protein BDZ45DRAFT_799379 [Acephala macrosclerotiorum]|nr:hypothetical protein BDZ45DRAFT_799379 [Acephala macrosclerotiorum]
MPFSDWPGGIPDYIKFDEAPIPYDDIDSLTNGWRYFIKEKWLPRPTSKPTDTLGQLSSLSLLPTSDQNPSYEVQQRRSLVTEWAQAPQSFRDHYQTLAASTPTKWESRSFRSELCGYVPNDDQAKFDWYTCIAPLDTPHNRALWTKLRILSYDISNGDMIQGIVTPSLVSQSPHSTRPSLELTDICKLWAVENADFVNMAMTAHGTVVFQGRNEWVIVDQKSLETGMLLYIGFESNGSPWKKLRITVLELNNIWAWKYGLGKGVQEMRHSYGYDKNWEDVDEGKAGDEINMTRPILHLLQDFSAMTHSYFDGRSEEQWRKLVEKIAPGYLALEEAGKSEDYDHSRFMRTP